MTTRIIDIAPNEVLLSQLADRMEDPELPPLTEQELWELVRLHPDSLPLLRRLFLQFRNSES